MFYIPKGKQNEPASQIDSLEKCTDVQSENTAKGVEYRRRGT